MKVVYEDNHLIIVYKESGEIVQGDKTGDCPLSETVKQYIKEKYHKPGRVFLGVVHRLDRPVSGLVLFTRTSKALARLNAMFRDGKVHKTYWALTLNAPRQAEGQLTHWLVRNERQNKSYAYDHEVPGSKKAVLEYRVLTSPAFGVRRADGSYSQGGSLPSLRYTLIEVRLLTGRHHQIRCQLATMGCPIKGDLKYGASRSNPDGSISLLSHKMSFIHPVSHEEISVVSPLPDDPLWQAMKEL